MPHHIRFLLKHAAIGAVLGQVFVGMLLYFNIVGLRDLVFGTADGIIALIVMAVLFAITFGSVQMGIAIMGLTEEDDDRDDHDEPPHGGRLIPIRVRIRDPRRK